MLDNREHYCSHLVFVHTVIMLLPSVSHRVTNSLTDILSTLERDTFARAVNQNNRILSVIEFRL